MYPPEPTIFNFLLCEQETSFSVNHNGYLYLPVSGSFSHRWCDLNIDDVTKPEIDGVVVKLQSVRRMGRTHRLITRFSSLEMKIL